MENNRELVLRIVDAEADTVSAINAIMQTYGLPCFLFELIIDKIHRQLVDGKSNEIMAARSREKSVLNSNSSV